MVQRLMVPVDGSHDSWRAVAVATALARRVDAPIDVVEVVMLAADLPDAERRVVEGVRELGIDDVEIAPVAVLAKEDVVTTLAEMLHREPGTTIVMSSHGRNRSAALLGSVTEELLHREFGPIVVVGPHVEATQFDGPLLVTVDGSGLSEQALPLGGAWAIELGIRPWVVVVSEPVRASSEHIVESSYPARLARKLRKQTNHPVEFEVLHGSAPHHAVADHAGRMGASMIVATTHGRTGLSRLRIGSTAAALVRHAPCPVLLLRPPVLRTDDGATSLRTAGAT